MHTILFDAIWPYCWFEKVIFLNLFVNVLLRLYKLYLFVLGLQVNRFDSPLWLLERRQLLGIVGFRAYYINDLGLLKLNDLFEFGSFHFLLYLQRYVAEVEG